MLVVLKFDSLYCIDSNKFTLWSYFSTEYYRKFGSIYVSEAKF